MNSGILDLEHAPLVDESALRNWGKTLVVAPHPDDESLGCGGTLALLRDLKIPVAVAFVSDGAASHPNSAKFAPPKLRDLREREARAALEILGVEANDAHFLRLPDGAVPFQGDADFAAASEQVRALLEEFAPQTMLVPWRRDPHRDHRASWELFDFAARDFAVQRVEYLVWAWERAASEDWPRVDEAHAIRVDISRFSNRKRAAIEAHQSQTTRLIDDDASGFWLSPEVLAHFAKPFETLIFPR